MADDLPDLLDSLPLSVLLALQEAATDPSETGRERAALRAADAGFYLHCAKAEVGSPLKRVLTEPIPMDPAPEQYDEAIELAFPSSEPPSEP